MDIQDRYVLFSYISKFEITNNKVYITYQLPDGAVFTMVLRKEDFVNPDSQYMIAIKAHLEAKWQEFWDVHKKEL